MSRAKTAGINKNLVRIRLVEMGMTQKELAKQIGFTDQGLSNALSAGVISKNAKTRIEHIIGCLDSEEITVAGELHKIAEELRLIRKELQRIAPIRKEIPDLETYFENLEDDKK